jgi:uncharacterized protein (UPF0276 family)
VLRGAGIGWRPEIGPDLLARRESADFVEVTAEACFQGHAAREARAVAEVWPVVVHGVKLSLGSADGIDRARARKLGELSRAVRAPAVTEHVAFVRGGGREIGHLTALPFTHEAVRVVARNVDVARRELPDVPLLLENVAWAFRWPEDALGEGEFYGAVTAATGCDLLLDVGNLYANAVNAGVHPVEALRSFPLDRVAMLHVAGGVLEDGFYFDTHAHAMSEEVLALVAEALAGVGDVPVVLERDAGFPPFSELASELSRVRTMRRGEAAGDPGPAGRAGVETTAAGATRLAAAQARLAAMLTSVDPPHAPRDVAPFDPRAIARARTILERKRVDDALPLLPRLARRGEPLRELALASVRRSERPDALVAVADALRIADAAAREPSLAADASIDRLVLRARFVAVGEGGRLRPRIAPFVGRERTAGGVVWAFKGHGAEACVRVSSKG